jgi:hypothetical protein
MYVLMHADCSGHVTQTVEPLQLILVSSLTDIQCTVYPVSSSGLIYFYSYIIDLLSGTVSV